MVKERIKSLREEKGVSQTTLGKAIGVGQSTVAMWENGKNKPEYVYLERIADYFRVSIDYLLGRSDRHFGSEPTKEDIKFALFNGAEGITDDMYDEVLKFADYVRHKYGKE
ncbi:MAG: helix-turn-helix transcriptional regulator [Clostridiales bacterium]|nr:helix-turn-helix transcriptional regulator [Clostridiales bacterium]